MTRPLWLPLVAVLGGCAVVPSPLDEASLVGLTKANLDLVVAGQEPLGSVVTLSEAIARALKYNLDAQVEAHQAALRMDEARLASMQLMPTVSVGVGHYARDTDLATGKLDLPTGLEIPPSTTSTERAYNSGELVAGWNVIDFALAYVRARQSADRHLIAVEARRKIAQRIIEDTRVAYWRAVSSERLSHRFAKLETRAKRAIRNARTAVRVGAETPMTGLSYERELTQISQTAEKLRHELVLAKSQLAALINVEPGTPLTLTHTIEQPDPMVGHLALTDLFAEAIFNRPEIRTLTYRERINEHEAHAAVLTLLPGAGLSGTQAFSDDRFLLHQNWTSVGASVGGNLLALLQSPARRRAVEAEGDVLRETALATTAAIMTQVVIARIRQGNAAEQVATAGEYRDVQAMLVRLLATQRDTGLVGEQTVVREEMNLLVAEVQYDIALGSQHSANAALMVSLGYDLQGHDVDLTQPVGAIAAHVRAAWLDRASISARGRYQAELAQARRDAERARMEVERRRRDEARRASAEARTLAADEAALRRAEAAQAKAAAERARTDSLRVQRHGRTSKSEPAAMSAPVWPWVWPQAAATDGAARPSRVYTGTK